MSHDTAESYLPSTKTSIQLMVNDQDWKQLELFEGTILDGMTNYKYIIFLKINLCSSFNLVIYVPGCHLLLEM